METTPRQSDVAYDAACKIIRPAEVRFLVSAFCALLLAVLYLWNSGETRWQHVIIQGNTLARLEERDKLSEALKALAKGGEEQNRLLAAIAAQLGVPEEE